MNQATLAAAIDLSTRVFVLLSLAGGVILVLRRAPARLRATVWSAALIGSLLVPVASRVLPSWQVPLVALPASWSATTPPPNSVSVSTSETVQVRALTPPVVAAIADGIAPNAATAQPVNSPGIRTFSSIHLVLIAWCGGAGMILLWQLLGHLRLAFLAARARPARDRRFTQTLARVSRMVGIARPVRLAISTEISTPVTWGAIRPVILLPAAAEGWLIERIEVVLMHEMVHIRCWHWPLRMLARTACAGHWYNPLAWLALHRLGLEQELASDEEVLGLGSRPSTYASHLLEIARASSPRLILSGAALDLARRTQLEGRIMAILDRRKSIRPGLALTIPTLLLMVCLVPAIGAVNPWAADGSPGPMPASTITDTEDVKDVMREMRRVEVEIEPFIEDMEEVEAAMQPYLDQIEDIEIDVEPLQLELEAAMKPLEAAMAALELEMEPLHEALAILHEQMAPVHEEMAKLHEQLEPYYERMADIHVDMEPFHQEMEHIHESMEPQLEELEGIHESMDGYHEKFEAIHEQMEPFHEQMEELGDRLEAALQRDVSQLIEDQMGPVCTSDAPFNEAAERVLESASIHVDDDGLRLRTSAADVRDILTDLLSPKQRPGTALDFGPAIAKTAQTIANYEVKVD